MYRAHVAMLVREIDPALDDDYLADALLAPLGADIFLYMRRAREMPVERIAEGYDQLLRGLFGQLMASRWRPTPRQLAQVLIGLWIFGIGEALIVASELGNSPWTVLAEGVSMHTPLSIGGATLAIGAAVLLCWIPLRERPGLGTVLNSIVIGISIDVTLELLPDAASRSARAGPRCSAGSRWWASAAASTSPPRSAPARATA